MLQQLDLAARSFAELQSNLEEGKKRFCVGLSFFFLSLSLQEFVSIHLFNRCCNNSRPNAINLSTRATPNWLKCPVDKCPSISNK